MSQFWNQRFSQPEYVYGTSPNSFFREQLDLLKPGKLLLPAEGEGRNAVYAARKGWEVTAFDFSEAGKEKALKLAASKGVQIKYLIHEAIQADFPKDYFDAIALVFAHFAPDQRQACHQKFVDFLKPGGVLILQGFHKLHEQFQAVNPTAGGPKNVDMLFDEAILESDFGSLKINLLETIETTLKEGAYHDGQSLLISMLGVKPLYNKFSFTQ